MKCFKLTLLQLFFCLSIFGQSKFELYKSAINSNNMKSLSELQIYQIEGQLTKNEKLDPGLNYFYLTSIFSSDQKFRNKYNYNRVSKGLIQNNYLKHLESKYSSAGISAYIYNSFIEPEVEKLMITDIGEINHEDKFEEVDENEKMIQFYFTLVGMSDDYKENFNAFLNYDSLWVENVQKLIQNHESALDKLTAQNIQTIPKSLFGDLIRFQSLLNLNGKSLLLTRTEDLCLAYLKRIDQIISLNGKRSINVGRLVFWDYLKMLSVNTSYNYAFFPKQTKNFIVNNGAVGVPFTVSQTTGNFQSLNIEVKFKPFYYYSPNTMLGDGYFSAQIGFQNPFITYYALNRISEDTKKSIIDYPHFRSETIRKLYTESTEIDLTALNIFSLFLPVASSENWGAFEVGTQFNYTSFNVNTKLDYVVQVDGINKENNNTYKLIYNQESEQFNEKYEISTFNFSVKYRTKNLVGLQSEILIGTSFSYVTIGFIFF